MWIARDDSGILCLFKDKPIKSFKVWLAGGKSEYIQIEANLFPDVKWADAEPTEVELVIKKKGEQP